MNWCKNEVGKETKRTFLFFIQKGRATKIQASRRELLTKSPHLTSEQYALREEKWFAQTDSGFTFQHTVLYLYKEEKLPRQTK